MAALKGVSASRISGRLLRGGMGDPRSQEGADRAAVGQGKVL